eukprot:5623-Pelagomonas_calceolata.AAC.3
MSRHSCCKWCLSSACQARVYFNHAQAYLPLVSPCLSKEQTKHACNTVVCAARQVLRQSWLLEDALVIQSLLSKNMCRAEHRNASEVMSGNRFAAATAAFCQAGKCPTSRTAGE